MSRQTTKKLTRRVKLTGSRRQPAAPTVPEGSQRRVDEIPPDGWVTKLRGVFGTDDSATWQDILIEAAQTKRLADRSAANFMKTQALQGALKAIYTAARGDEKSECWTIRTWLDQRNVFNDDLGSAERLIEAACAFALLDTGNGWSPRVKP